MRYDRRDFNSAKNAARCMSKKDGRLRFIHATYYGWHVGLKRVKFQDSWWTNGLASGLWRAFAPKGEAEPTAEITN